MKVEIRQYQEGDLERIKPALLEDAVKNYPDMFPPKTSFTCLVDGKIVGIWGVLILWEGVGETWIFLTKDVLDFKVATYKFIHREMLKLIKDNKLRRLQATIRADFPKAITMIERLGFKREGKMIGYCPDGQNAYLYARINGVFNDNSRT